MRRGIEILLALGTDQAVAIRGLGVLKVSELVGREKSQVSRSLRTLAEYGLVERDAETLGYRLGARLFVLGTRASESGLLAAAPGVLAQLVDRLGETAHVSVLQGGEVLTLVSESPEHAIRVADWVGKSAPAHCTSAGRVLLLDHDPAGLEALFGGVGFPAAGPRAPDTVGELAARIAVDRARGYALVDEEFEAGLVGVAAPIRDARGRIVAALNVSAPKFRFGGRMAAVGPDLRVTADELSAVLGWSRQDEMAAS